VIWYIIKDHLQAIDKDLLFLSSRFFAHAEVGQTMTTGDEEKNTCAKMQKKTCEARENFGVYS
jgi:hypothetical protein